MLRRVLEEGWSPAEAAEAAGVSVRTFYKWLQRQRQEGEKGLLDRSSRPVTSPNRLSKRKEKRILALRRSKMSGKAVAQAVKVSAATVSRRLRRHGLSRARDLEPPVPKRRYEKSKPGELIHMDTKKLGRFRCAGHRVHGDYRRRSRGSGWEVVHVCIDDHTRLAYVEILPDEKVVTVLGFVDRARAWFLARGVPWQGLMTDNGPAYMSKLFRLKMEDLGIRHVRTRPYTPRTNGKAERFIQTALREWAYATSYETSDERARALAPWLHSYNHFRPHHGIGGQPPVSRLSVNNLLEDYN